jgi:hypothetical protein
LRSGITHAPAFDDVAVMHHEAIDEGCGHDLIKERLAAAHQSSGQRNSAE